MKQNFVAIFSLLGCLTGIFQPERSSNPKDQYTLVYNQPGASAVDSMPLGNGDIGVNAWIEGSTGDLVFYIGKTDAWSENCRLLKVGKVTKRVVTPQSRAKEIASNKVYLQPDQP